MKINVALFLASISSTAAFVSPVARQGCSSLRMVDERDEEWGGVAMDVKNLSPNKSDGSVDTTPVEKKAPTMSPSMPFMKCNPVLNGSMAGDVGFDPLGFAKSPLDLTLYREAEIKHARLAMLAAAGWPISELFDKPIANLFGLTPVLDDMGRVPSVLNGGMEKISPMYWGACIVIASAIDVFGLAIASKKSGYIPGDLGFDPFGLYPKDDKGKKWMQNAEIKNGRLAMIAITAFCVHELVGGTAVVDQTPFFFKPITQVLQDASTSGYISPPPVDIPPVDIPSVLDSVDIPSVLDSVDIPSIDSAAAAAAEAVTSITPPIDAAATTAAEAASSAVTSSVDAFSAAPAVNAPVEGVAAPAVADYSDLMAAKLRITELESQLAAIKDVSR